MTEFWSLPYGVHIRANDSEIPRLEKLAAMRGCEWDWEFDGVGMHFRFASEQESKLFELWANFLRD